MRAALSLLLLVGCASTRNTPAVTLERPTALPTPSVDYSFARRVDAARKEIEAEHFDAASAALVAIVCGSDQTDFEKCPAGATTDAASAWSLIGDIAAQHRFVRVRSGLAGARQIVGRWSPADADEQLGIAELAYTRASAVSSSERAGYLFKLGNVRYDRGHFAEALRTFVRVLDGPINDPARDHKADAIQRASVCIALKDWDGDDEDDAVRGFARPEVVEALAHDAMYTPLLYLRALEAMASDESCDDARDGLADMTRRFPASPATVKAQGAVALDCP